jgi:hypothetical protein
MRLEDLERMYEGQPKKKKKMKVSGSSVKKLQKIIINKKNN